MKPIERRKYPYGIQVFSIIRKENYLYVDKTEYVYRMTHSDNRYMFLNRPRRFGKSLLTDTLHCYFEGRKGAVRGACHRTAGNGMDLVSGAALRYELGKTFG